MEVNVKEVVACLLDEDTSEQIDVNAEQSTLNIFIELPSSPYLTQHLWSYTTAMTH